METNQTFDFPSFHSVPPYYTLQTCAETREAQLELWTRLIVNYAKFKGIRMVTVNKGSIIGMENVLENKLHQ
eukprot:gnl/Chilomastix_caulleri/5663.p2 GENE.gnl/Chilomastix_caulleri/5663~~gnl/Chilomastix_caulleri/5663.p2  ORF type:complete len:72 (+),score=1.48 gnl/Chilomastix_caulleri/5663:69-284(+)